MSTASDARRPEGAEAHGSAVPAQQPDETGNQFAAISNGSHELMFQTFKSAEDDAPAGTEPSHDFQLPADGCYAKQLAGVLGGAFGGFLGSRIGD